MLERDVFILVGTFHSRKPSRIVVVEKSWIVDVHDFGMASTALFLICTLHPFFDGNRRTGPILCEALLGKGIGIASSEEEINSFLGKAASMNYSDEKE